jgi:hypothetical protein
MTLAIVVRLSTRVINEWRQESVRLPIQRHTEAEFSAQDINEPTIECIPSNSET